MAKCLSMMGEMSGSIGGCTWSRNKGGQYLRQRTVPTNPNSIAQQAVRTAFAQASSDWSATLTNSQRTMWNNWAASNPVVDTLGQSIQLSGQQAYVRFSARLLQCGMASVSTPPSTMAPAAPTFDDVQVAQTAAGIITVTFLPTPMPADLFFQIWSSKVLNVGQNPNRRGAKLKGTTGAAEPSPFLAGGYHGAVGQKVVIWVNSMDASGQVSPPTRYDTTLT